MEIKKLTPRQQKAAWYIGGTLFIIHFLPSFAGSIRQAFSHHASNVAAVASQHPAPAPSIAARPAAPAADPFAAQYIGFFQGTQLTPEMSNCHTSLEVRPALEKAGFYSGFATMNCTPSALFYRGPLTAQRQGKMEDYLKDAAPINASMTGSITDGDMAFRVDKVVGATPEHCGPSTFAISSFGTNQVMAQWEQAPPCKGPAAHMVLIKKRA